MEQKSRKKTALIFLNGCYPDEHITYYLDAIKSRSEDCLVIAVDGGLNLFDRYDVKPDIIIGDFDSVKPETADRFPAAGTIKIDSTNKMFTDCESALKFCIDKGIGNVIILGGIDARFETDHLLGNIFLLIAYKKSFGSITMRDYCQEIIPLENEIYEGKGKPGDFISILPLIEKVKFNATGLKYDPGGKIFEFGGTTPLRNELLEADFRIDLTGKALLVRHY